MSSKHGPTSSSPKTSTSPQSNAAHPSSTTRSSTTSVPQRPGPDAHRVIVAMSNMDISSRPQHQGQQRQQPTQADYGYNHNHSQPQAQTEAQRFAAYPSYPTYEADSVNDFWEPPPRAPAAHQTGFHAEGGPRPWGFEDDSRY